MACFSVLLRTRGQDSFVQVNLLAGGAAGCANIWALRLILNFFFVSFFFFKKAFEFRAEFGEVSLYRNYIRPSSHAMLTACIPVGNNVVSCMASGAWGLGSDSSMHVLDGFNRSAL